MTYYSVEKIFLSISNKKLCNFFLNFIKKVLQKVVRCANIIHELNLRSWRNRQTRTFEGRMGDRMGSSPIDRTKQE